MKSLHLLFLFFPFLALSQKKFDHLRDEIKQNNKYEYVYGFENRNIYLSKEFIVKQKNKYGVVNSENQIVVPIEYDESRKIKEHILFTKDHKKVKKIHWISN